MSSTQTPSTGTSNPGSIRRVLAASAEAEALASLRRSLLIAALETPPRFRSDIDVVIIQQHLANQGVFASVAPQVLQYLATECTISRIPDGEVLFYQEDIVDDHSYACIILEGSLCGYFNKAFSQRHSKGDNFRSWNGKKTNARGVTIDFGDLQVTYGKGSICGIDDLYAYPLTSSSREGRHHMKPLSRRRSVHSQESTTIIILAKDTLDRVTERYGLVYERGILSSTKETPRTDVAHLALFSLLSDTARKALLHSAETRQLKLGEVIFDADTGTAAFVIVRNGCLDIYCVGCDDARVQNPAVVNGSQSNSTMGNKNAASSTPGVTAAPKDPVVSLSRGQTFGDQMITLGLPHLWASNPRRRRSCNVQVRFKVVAGDSSTEVLWVTRDRFEQLLREDRLRLSYNPIYGTAASTTSTASLISAIESRDISQITRQMLTNATLSKFFFQFPPIVLDRLCHHIEIQHYDSHGMFLEAGGSINNVCIIVTGALHSHHCGSESDRSAAKKITVHQGNAKRMPFTWDVHFIPGDAFGARELMKRCSSSEAPVFVDAGTILICIARPTFERWVSPMRHNTIVKAGSILQPFVWSTSSPPASPRLSYTNNYPSLVKVNRRQSGPSVFLNAVVDHDKDKARRLDEAAILLKRFGLFQTLPRFLLAQMLTQATLQCKTAGEELFREGDTQRSLVVILNGFVSFYSLENMAATIDMFQRHPFCIFAAFAGSTTNPEDFVAEPRPDQGGSIPSAALKHRAAMHGAHIQTLPPRNAFRTGVLQESTVCPATVLAQTDCEYLVFDENVYAWLLAEHAPAVDMRGYVAPPEPSENAVTSASKDSFKPGTQPASKAPIPRADNRSGVIPPSLLSFLEGARIPWLSPSTAKRTLLLRSMQHIHLAPGQRLIKHNEVLRQLVFVVSGKLAVYVRENQEVVTVLNASQRSVQSAALEKSVASNYSTMSNILYQERTTSVGLSNRRALQRKIARIAEMDTLGDESNRTSANSRFTDFVLHAAKEAKNQQASITEKIEQVRPKAPPTRKSLHSMVNKVKFQRKTGDQNSTDTAVELKESSKTLFMFHLGPGDIYGDEITAPSGVFHCVHDIYADTLVAANSGATESGTDRPHTVPVGTEVLCLDRSVLHSIIAKTEEEAANELIGRSSDAKAKWQVASKKLFKRSSHSRLEEPGEFIRIKKTPKLFDFFKNILNQRRFLTMGTLAHFPLLRDLPEDSRRELCLNARFEALDRYTDAFKGNGDSNGPSNQFFLLLTGRVNLVANGPNSHIVSQNTNSSTADPELREICAGEGFGEFDILVPEAPAYTAAIAAEPTKLLSIPADMFMKHWPCIQETRGNIEYLRTQIPSFASLDLERIAYLYHSFSFQTHVRRTNIFQLHDNKQGSATRNEVYFIKEGTCCIRQYVTLTSHLDTELRFDPNNNEPPQTAKTMKTIKVLATVADVSAGHIFWVDNDQYPISVVATSATVTIASISIDKLKAIVPRGQLTGIEDLSGQLRDLYGKQFELAKRVTATVMNEKLATQIRGPQSSRRLPTLHLRAGQSVSPEDEHIFQCGTEEQKLHDDVDPNANNYAASDMVNAVYNAQHQIERYDISNEMFVSNLAGSFLDNKYDTNSCEGQLMRKFANDPFKQDEYNSPEVVAGSTVVQQNEASSLVKLNVNADTAHRLNSKTLVNTATSDNKKSPSMKSGRGIALMIQDEIIQNDDGYEVDVRARVQAQMCTIESPMRSMRLEPSRAPVNSLGKYYADSPSTFTKPGGSYRRQQFQTQSQSPLPPTKPHMRPPQNKTNRSNPQQLQANRPLDSLPHPALTRKQGFLIAFPVRNAVTFDGDGREILDTIIPQIHRGRRFFYALVDSELREYADTVTLSSLAQTPCLHRYNLYNPRQACTVVDVPVTRGGVEALLRQSFLLIVDNATQFFFTAASAIDKQTWMAELNQACVLGGLQHPISGKVQSPRPIAATLPQADPSTLAAVVIDAFKGRRKSTIEGRRSSICVPKPKPDDTLQVEYRIS